MKKVASPHNRAYTPPIPSLRIIVQSPNGQATEPLSAVLDSGADITLVSLNLLEQINAPEQDEVRLRSHWGDYIGLTTYLVEIRFGIETLPAIEVVGDLHTRNEVLLGRDVLNKLSLLINGPQQTTEIIG